MPAVLLVLGVVATVLPCKVDLMFLGVGFVEVFRRHAEHLSNGDEKVEQVDDLDAGVLLVELLVFRPPFPRHAISQFSDLLAHGPAIVQYPLLALFVSHAWRINANLEIELFLKAKNLLELVGLGHSGSIGEMM